MISREQVADLRQGDVVELVAPKPLSTVVRGRLHNYFSPPDSFGLSLGAGLPVRRADGGVAQQWLDSNWTLTVVSRAPRRLYVNHDRTEPAAADVVRDADDDSNPRIWMHLGGGRNDWAGHRIGDMVLFTSGEMPKRLRLLVDGETGQVVP